VPWRAEYLPVPTQAASFAAFDAWLTQANDFAVNTAGSSWPVAFAAGAMHGFVFHAPGDPADSVLCGALAPSRDSAGRPFPVGLAVPLRVSPELLKRPELLPFALETPWAEATAALADLMSGPPPAPAVLHAGQAGDVAEAAGLYGDWASALPLAELWALLGPALASPAVSLRFVLETLSPLREAEPVQSTLSLRLPLGLGGGASLCFWLDVIRRALGWRSTLPSFFWSHDGSSGAALVHLGRPSKAALAELWLPTGRRDDIADLTHPIDAGLGEALSPLPRAIADVLEDARASLGQLLAAIGT
jgi:type VI secretion system ImpM family protein